MKIIWTLGPALLLSAACANTPSSTTGPTGADLAQPTVQASAPPYGESHYLGHTGQVWYGSVPYNPCKVVPTWAGHRHTLSVELYDHFDEFVGWQCQGGQSESEGSTVGILD